ncbi:hypothetical protein ACYOEI_03610 [Singulisphaera rosea]
MALRTRRASWIVLGLFLVAATFAGLEAGFAQSGGGASKSTLDANFVSLDSNKIVNINNIAYVSDGGELFDIYFACSAARAPDPLRLTGSKDVAQARSLFNDKGRTGGRFERHGMYWISVDHIAFIETKVDSVVINFNARVFDSYASLTLTGADAERFRKR